MKSCTMLAVEADGCSVTTIEGLAKPASSTPMQESFHKHHALQCGFCTPGMIVGAVELVEKRPDADEHQTREWLEGNFCRCTGYHTSSKPSCPVGMRCGRKAHEHHHSVFRIGGAAIPRREDRRFITGAGALCR